MIKKFKKLINNDEQDLIREITKNGKIIKRLNTKNKVEIMVLNKYYNY